MLLLAVKNLVQERDRLLISIGGVAFSVLLIMSIQGLCQGWSANAAGYIWTVQADYWVTQRGAADMFPLGPPPRPPAQARGAHGANCPMHSAPPQASPV